MVNLLPSRRYIPAELCQTPEISVQRVAKTFLRQSTVCWLVARMAFGAGKGVNVLIVVLAVLTRHLQFSPDRFGEIRSFCGDFTLAVFFARSFLHGTLLSVKNHITCIIC